MRAGEGGTFVCDHCGSMAQRTVSYALDTFGASPLACPRCAKPLLEARIEGCAVQYCSTCEGVLVAMKYFMTLSEAVRARAPRRGVALPRTDPSELQRIARAP